VAIGKRKEVKKMILRRNKKEYWEMSPLEKQIKYKDLNMWQRYNLHHEEMRKFAQEQMKKQQEQEKKKREAQ
jgi:hypothetical protein